MLFIVRHKYLGLQRQFSCVAHAVSAQARHGRAASASRVGVVGHGRNSRKGRGRPELQAPAFPPARDSAREGFHF